MGLQASCFMGRLAGTNTASVPALEIINTSATKSAYVKRIWCFLTEATATSIGIGFPAAAGITPSAPVLFLNQEGGPANYLKTAIAWGTPPTAPVAFFDQRSQVNVIGSPIEFVFSGQGILLMPGKTLVVHNIGNNSHLNISVEASEETSVVVNS